MKEIIKQIASKNGVSVNSVEKEINAAIVMAMKNRNNNEVSRKFWNSISPNGEVPSLEKFLQACSLLIS